MQLINRDELRRNMLSRRRSMTDQEVNNLSRRICSRLERLYPVTKANVIMGYNSINNEVNLIPWLVELKRQGRTIVLPRVQGGQLQAVEVNDWNNMAPGPFGIKEPLGDPIAIEKIDVVLVPGIVFDAKGYRLGYGKGYYDLFLPGLSKQCFNCGVCYEYQVIDNVFPHKKDVAVHWIVTDQSEIAIDMNYF
ncbi:MAG: 5-formyltetrahydrofolate cyclo-ligase [Syntrophomonadaceae bacterium]|jgi:5-formyltetrahydrofolate cyclo-ligase